MENELDLTLRLGLPSPTVETQLSLVTLTTDQEINVDSSRRDNNNGMEISDRRLILWNGDKSINNDVSINDDEGASSNVDVNIRYYNYVFNHFAGIGDTLNFSPFPMPPPEIPGSDYVMIDVPPRRAYRNSLAIQNALDANANLRQHRGCIGFCGGMIEGTRKCTNMKCNAIKTPMWRKGPLGPKTLCNACGIKFRKEGERRSKGISE